MFVSVEWRLLLSRHALCSSFPAAKKEIQHGRRLATSALFLTMGKYMRLKLFFFDRCTVKDKARSPDKNSFTGLVQMHLPSVMSVLGAGAKVPKVW